MKNEQRIARIREIEAQPTGMVTVAQQQEELILLAELCMHHHLNWRDHWEKTPTWRMKMIKELESNGIQLLPKVGVTNE